VEADWDVENVRKALSEFAEITYFDTPEWSIDPRRPAPRRA